MAFGLQPMEIHIQGGDMKTKLERKTYNKATVIEKDGVAYLQSYDTIVCGINLETKEFYRFWDGFSRTTQRHIQMFCDEYMVSGKVALKDNWESIPLSHTDVNTKRLNYRVANHISPIWGYIPYGYQRNY